MGSGTLPAAGGSGILSNLNAVSTPVGGLKLRYFETFL